MHSGIRVLHVEDDPDYAAMTSNHLERRSLEVTTIPDPGDALENFDPGIDCIISDYDLPEMNGLEFLEAVRSRDPTLPFILYTGKGTEDIASAAISAGVTDYIQKESGFDHFDLLANRIENAVSQSRSHRQLETLISNLPGMVYRCSHTPDWPVEFVGGETEPLTGYTSGELQAEVVTIGGDLMHPDDRERVWVEVNDALAGEEPFEVTYRLQSKDGTEKWVWERGRKVEPSDREAPVIEGFIIDITSRRETEEALRREREFIEQSLEILEDIFYVFGPDLTLTRWNNQFAEVSGYSDAELEAMSPLDFFGPEDHTRVTDALAEIFEGGSARIEAELVTKSDERIPFEFSGSLMTDSDGEPLGVAGIGRNITNRRRREDRLRRLSETLATLHERTRTLLEADDREEIADVAVQSIDHVLGLNMAAIWLYDADQDALVPTAFTEASDTMFDHQPTFTPEEASISWEAFQENETHVIQDMHEHGGRYNPDTEIRSELVVPLDDRGILNVSSTEVGGFSETDITLAELWAATVTTTLNRYRQQEQLRSREQEVSRERDRLDEFASLVSHDLRNPLTVALGNLRIVAEDTQNERIDRSLRSLERMEDLIEQMLMLSREGESVADLEDVDLGGVLRLCWENVDTAEATLQIEDELIVQADPTRLAQVLENLMRNAIDHAGTEATITVGSLPDRPGFYFEDDGPGIPPDERDAIFRGGYTTEPDGNGLGLSIVRQIVRAHGWEITVTDGARDGARFEVTT